MECRHWQRRTKDELVSKAHKVFHLVCPRLQAATLGADFQEESNIFIIGKGKPGRPPLGYKEYMG